MIVKKMKIRDAFEDRMMYFLFDSILILFGLIIMYPCIFILSASFSNSADVFSGRVLLWPVNPSLDGYRMVFSHKLILSSYRNTIFYTITGTTINLIMTILAAYPMSRKEMPFRNILMFVFVFTMFFGGGLVPTYLLMNMLGILNTIWVMILPTFSVYSMILMRTNFLVIPVELYDASIIDGCSYWKFLIKIILPLSKAVLAVITLGYAVGHWNAYFSAFIYLRDRELYPLQLVLRSILMLTQLAANDMTSTTAIELSSQRGMADLIKYSLIVVAAAPILSFYPFIQKYFVTGIMIGSIKG